ncbi:hypothetical protein BDQ17DRAFT_1330858 [Cyathus striatus]|nr:hypothetical protein BDQ17DRAFT_1330858 [Cyathus striatus]
MRFSLSIVALLYLSTVGLALQRKALKASSLYVPSEDSLARISRLRESRLSMPFEELEPISPYRKPIRTFRAQGAQYGGARRMRAHRGKGYSVDRAHRGSSDKPGRGAALKHLARPESPFSHGDEYESV